MTEQPHDIQEIDRRLKEARQKSEKKPNKTVSLNTMIEAAFRITLDFAAPIIVAVCVGYLADKIFATQPLMLIICIVFGVAAGLWELYKTAQKMEEK